MPWTRRTIHSATPSFPTAHQMTFPGHWVKCLLKIYESHIKCLVGRCILSCSCLTTKTASVVPLPRTKPNWVSSVDTTCLIRPSTILSRTHDLLCQLETRVVSPVQCIPFTLVETDNETLLPVGGYFAIMDDCSCQVTNLRGAHVTRCSYHLHHMPDGPGALPASPNILRIQRLEGKRCRS